MYNKEKRVVNFRTALIPLLLIFFLAGLQVETFAGTNGKISGRITDAETGEALLGANVVVEGLSLIHISEPTRPY